MLIVGTCSAAIINLYTKQWCERDLKISRSALSHNFSNARTSLQHEHPERAAVRIQAGLMCFMGSQHAVSCIFGSRAFTNRRRHPRQS